MIFKAVSRIGARLAWKYGQSMDRVSRQEYIRDVETVSAWQASVHAEATCPDDPMPMAVSILRCRAIDLLRSRTHNKNAVPGRWAVMQAVQGTHAKEYEPYMQASDDDPVENTEMQQGREWIDALLRNMSETHAHVWVQVARQGRQPTEVARELGISPGRVSQILKEIAGRITRRTGVDAWSIVKG